jgi:hypothetical protein
MELDGCLKCKFVIMVITVMLDQYKIYFAKLQNVFNKNFIKTTKCCTNKGILNIVPEFYIKWLYSPLSVKSYLTPANVFQAIAESFDLDYFPAVKNMDNGQIIVEPQEYTLSNHPVIDDIKILINHFYDIYDLDSDINFSDKNVQIILSMISMNDINYLEYLKSICYQLGIFESTASIYCKKLFLGDKAIDFINKDPEEAFVFVVSATIEILFDNLCSMFSIETNEYVFSVESDRFHRFIFNLFKSYDKSIDYIIKNVLLYFDINESIFRELANVDLLDDCIYFLNITINRFFFLTFGHYLKLIMPIYAKPFNLKLNLHIAKKCLIENKDIFQILDFCNTKFILTNLGLSYLSLDNCILSNKISLKEIDFIIRNFENITDKNYPKCESTMCYRFRIVLVDDKKYWKVFDCNSCMVLRELAMIINENFLVHSTTKYNFTFVNDTGSLDESKRINDLGFKLGDVFYLTFRNAYCRYLLSNRKSIKNCVQLKISLIKISSSVKNIFFDYRLVCMSKALRKNKNAPSTID